jgi:hypothetical protein
MSHFEALRLTRTAAHGLLPLAEGVLRERRGRLRAEEASQPLSRPGAIAYLEKKNQAKDEVLAEHVALKNAW